MDQSTSVELATPEDIPALVALLKILFNIEHDFIPNPKKQEKGLELLLSSNTARVFVYRKPEGRRILGMATVQLLVSTAQGGLSAQIEDVVVAPDSRGKGIGARMLEGCRKWSVEQGATRMQLAADDRNLEAEKFYLRQGWVRSEMRLFRQTLKEEN